MKMMKRKWRVVGRNLDPHLGIHASPHHRPWPHNTHTIKRERARAILSFWLYALKNIKYAYRERNSSPPNYLSECVPSLAIFLPSLLFVLLQVYYRNKEEMGEFFEWRDGKER